MRTGSILRLPFSPPQLAATCFAFCHRLLLSERFPALQSATERQQFAHFRLSDLLLQQFSLRQFFASKHSSIRQHFQLL